MSHEVSEWVELPKNPKELGPGMLRESCCQKTGTLFFARVRPLADGSWQAWASAHHPKSVATGEMKYFGLRTAFHSETWGSLELAKARAEEQAQLIAEWVGAEWS
jgi:hypothetical protein